MLQKFTSSLVLALATLAPLTTFAQTPTIPFDTTKVTLSHCTPSITGNPMQLTQGEAVTFTCTLKSTLSTPTSVLISVNSKTPTSTQGEGASASLFNLAPREATTTTLYTLAPFQNGTYTYTIGLAAAIQTASTAPKSIVPFGKTVSFTGTLNVPTLKIATATFDKTNYAPGASGFVTLTIASTTTPQPYYVNILTEDTQGNTCSLLSRVGPITSTSGTYVFTVPAATSTCATTQLAASILSTTGFVMDTKTLPLTSFGATSSATATPLNTGGLLAGGIAIVIILILGALFSLYRKRAHPEPTLPDQMTPPSL